jgi:hypothetical protein
LTLTLTLGEAADLPGSSGVALCRVSLG